MNKEIQDLTAASSVALTTMLAVKRPGDSEATKMTLGDLITFLSSSGVGVGAVFTDNFVVQLPINNTGVPNGTAVHVGDSVSGFLKQLMRKATPPTYTQPAATLSANVMPTLVETGYSFVMTFAIAFIQNDAGAETSRALYRDGVPMTPAMGVYSDTVVASLTPVVFQAEIFYATGLTKNDDLGNPNPTGKILAGSKLSNTLTYVGLHKYFADCIAAATAFPSTSAGVRFGAISQLSNNKTINIVFDLVKTKAWFWVPTGTAVVSIIDNGGALPVNITHDYTDHATALSVNDAGGAAVTGTIYEFTQLAAYTLAHTHVITLA